MHSRHASTIGVPRRRRAGGDAAPNPRTALRPQGTSHTHARPPLRRTTSSTRVVDRDPSTLKLQVRRLAALLEKKGQELAARDKLVKTYSRALLAQEQHVVKISSELERHQDLVRQFQLEKKTETDRLEQSQEVNSSSSGGDPDDADTDTDSSSTQDQDDDLTELIAQLRQQLKEALQDREENSQKIEKQESTIRHVRLQLNAEKTEVRNLSAKLTESTGSLKDANAQIESLQGRLAETTERAERLNRDHSHLSDSIVDRDDELLALRPRIDQITHERDLLLIRVEELTSARDDPHLGSSMDSLRREIQSKTNRISELETRILESKRRSEKLELIVNAHARNKRADESLVRTYAAKSQENEALIGQLKEKVSSLEDELRAELAKAEKNRPQLTRIRSHYDLNVRSAGAQEKNRMSMLIRLRGVEKEKVELDRQLSETRMQILGLQEQVRKFRSRVEVLESSNTDLVECQKKEGRSFAEERKSFGKRIGALRSEMRQHVRKQSFQETATDRLKESLRREKLNSQKLKTRISERDQEASRFSRALLEMIHHIEERRVEYGCEKAKPKPLAPTPAPVPSPSVPTPASIRRTRLSLSIIPRKFLDDDSTSDEDTDEDIDAPPDSSLNLGDDDDSELSSSDEDIPPFAKKPGFSMPSPIRSRKKTPKTPKTPKPPVLSDSDSELSDDEPPPRRRSPGGSASPSSSRYPSRSPTKSPRKRFVTPKKYRSPKFSDDIDEIPLSDSDSDDDMPPSQRRKSPQRKPISLSLDDDDLSSDSEDDAPPMRRPGHQRFSTATAKPSELLFILKRKLLRCAQTRLEDNYDLFMMKVGKNRAADETRAVKEQSDSRDPEEEVQDSEEVSRLTARISSMNRKLLDGQSKSDSLQKELDDSATEIRVLKDRIETLETKDSAEISRLNARIGSMNLKLLDSRSKLDSMRTKLDDAEGQSQSESLVIKVASLERKLILSEAEVEKLSGDLKEKEMGLKSLADDNKALVDALRLKKRNSPSSSVSSSDELSRVAEERDVALRELEKIKLDHSADSDIRSTEINQLSSQLKREKDIVVSLESKLADANDESTRLKLKMDMLNEELPTLRGRLRDKIEQIERLTVEFESGQDSRKRLESELSEVKKKSHDDISALQVAVAELKTKNELLSEAVSTAQVDHRRLSDTLFEADRARSKVVDFETSKLSSDQTIQILQEHRDELREQLKTAVLAREELQSNAIRLTSEKENLGKLLSELKTDLSGLRSKLNERNAVVEDLEQRLASSTAKRHEETVLEFEKEVKSLTEKCTAAEITIAELRSRFESADASLTQANESNAGLTLALGSLKEMNSVVVLEKSEAKEKIASAEGELKELRERLFETHDKLGKLTTEKELLVVRLENAQDLQASSEARLKSVEEDFRENRRSLQESIRREVSARDSVNGLTLQLASAKESYVTLLSSQSEVKSLASEEETQKLKVDLAISEESVGRLKEENAAFIAELDTSRSSLVDLKATNGKLELDNSELRDLLEQNREKVSSLEKESFEMVGKLALVTKKKEVLEGKVERMLEKVAVLEKTQADSDTVASSTEDRLKELDEEKARSTEEKSELEARLRQGQEEATELKHKIRTLEDALVFEGRDKKRLESDIRSANVRISEERSALENVKNRLEETTHEFSVVQEDLRSCRNELRVSRENCSEFEKKASDLARELSVNVDCVATSERERDEKAEEIRSMKQHAEDLQRRNSALKLNIEELENQVREANRRAADTEDAATELLTERQHLSKALEEAHRTQTALTEDFETIRSEKVALQDENLEHSHRIRSLERELSESSRKFRNSEEASSELNSQLKELQSSLHVAEASSSDLRRQVTSLSQDKQELSDEKARLKARADRLMDELGDLTKRADGATTETQSLQHSVAEAVAVREKLTAQIDEGKGKLAHAVAEVSVVRGTVRDLEAKLMQAEARSAEAETTIESLNQKLLSAIDQAGQLRGDLMSKDESYDSLLSEKLRIEGAKELINMKLESTLARTKDADDKIATLRAKLREANDSMRESSAASVDIVKQLMTLKVSNSGLLSEKLLLEDRAQSLQSLSSSLRDENVALEKKMEALHSEKGESQSELRQLNDSVAEITSDKERLEEALRETAEKLESIRKAVEEKNIDNGRLSEEVSSLNARLAAATEHTVTLKESYDNLQKERDELLVEVRDLRRKVESQTRTSESASDTVEILRSEASAMSTDLSAAREKLSARLSEIEEKQDEIDYLQVKLVTSNGELDVQRKAMEELKKDRDAIFEKSTYHESTISMLTETKETAEAELASSKKTLEEKVAELATLASENQKLKKVLKSALVSVTAVATKFMTSFVTAIDKRLVRHSSRIAAFVEKISSGFERKKVKADDTSVQVEAFSVAVHHLNELTPNDVVEVEGYHRPPPLIEVLVKAMLLMLGAPPPSVAEWALAKRYLKRQILNRMAEKFNPDRVSKTTYKVVGEMASRLSRTEVVHTSNCAAVFYEFLVTSLEIVRVKLKKKAQSGPQQGSPESPRTPGPRSPSPGTSNPRTSDRTPSSPTRARSVRSRPQPASASAGDRVRELRTAGRRQRRRSVNERPT